MNCFEVIIMLKCSTLVHIVYRLLDFKWMKRKGWLEILSSTYSLPRSNLPGLPEKCISPRKRDPNGGHMLQCTYPCSYYALYLVSCNWRIHGPGLLHFSYTSHFVDVPQPFECIHERSLEFKVTFWRTMPHAFFFILA